MTERPQFVPAYVRMAEAHAMNNELNLASDTLLSALKIDPKSREAAMVLVRVEMLARQYDKAEEQLHKMVQDNPNDLDARAALGDLYAVKKDAGRAEAEYGQMKRIAPNNPAGSTKLAYLFASEGKLDKARIEFEAALKLAPDSPMLLTSVLRIYLAEKKYDLATSLCEERIKRNASDALAYDLLGQVKASRKDFKGAEVAYNKAAELQPNWTEPLRNLAQLYVIQGQTDMAVKRLEDRLKSAPDDVNTRFVVAQLYNMSRKYAEAMDAYEKILQKLPDNWAAENDLAFLLCEQGKSGKDLERALTLAQKAVNARPDEPSTEDTLGWVYYKRGDLNHASDLIGKAYLKAGDNPVIAYHMGMVSYKAGKPAEAKTYLAKAVKSSVPFEGKEEAQKTLEKL